MFLYACFQASPSSTGEAYTLSTGMSKNPWIWSACRSTVSSRFTPALEIMFATSFAVIADARRARPPVLARSSRSTAPPR